MDEVYKKVFRESYDPTKALEKKVLNSKNAVIYDIETEKITEIKNLVMHQNAEGEYSFQILDKPIRNSITMRRKPDTPRLPLNKDTNNTSV